MVNIEIKNGYFRHTVDACFVTRPIFFLFYYPVTMWVYTSIKNYFVGNNYIIDWSVGMIEKPRKFGLGYAGLAHTSGDRIINGTFIAYKVVGDYNQLKGAYRKIMNDYKNSYDFYQLYLTDPKTTDKQKNITYILFKSN
jgi:hypothetical protein